MICQINKFICYDYWLVLIWIQVFSTESGRLCVLQVTAHIIFIVNLSTSLPLHFLYRPDRNSVHKIAIVQHWLRYCVYFTSLDICSTHFLPFSTYPLTTCNARGGQSLFHIVVKCKELTKVSYIWYRGSEGKMFLFVFFNLALRERNI